MENIKKTIENQINNNELLIYIKGTPKKPLCGFSAQVIYILNELELNYFYIDIIENDDIRRYLPIYSKWPTYPQVYYKKKLIGGADIISEFYKKNTLKNILTS